MNKVRTIAFSSSHLHRGRRQHFRQEQHGEPSASRSDHFPEADLHIGFVECFHAAQLLKVFRGFLDDGVHDVVDCYDPDKEL